MRSVLLSVATAAAVALAVVPASAQSCNTPAQCIERALRLMQDQQEPCPDPDAVARYGFCIWLVPERSMTFQQAAAACRDEGGRLCTLAEVSAAQATGAEWCNWGWTADRVLGATDQAYLAYPMQTTRRGCGSAGLNYLVTSFNTLSGATCCR